MQAAAALDTDAEVPPARPQRPIDLVHLSKFTMGQRDVEAEILGLFRQQLAASLDRLADAADLAGDDAAWREAAHTLKGSARGVGAWALADRCQGAEKLADGDTRRVAVSELADLVAAATAFIDELLADWHG